jgi:hypothetical protein
VDVVERVPIGQRRIALKQCVKQGAKLDGTPGLGRSAPDPKRKFLRHGDALVEQPRLAEAGAALHHDYAAGAGPDLAQSATNDRELLLTSTQRRPGRIVHSSNSNSRNCPDRLTSLADAAGEVGHRGS